MGRLYKVSDLPVVIECSQRLEAFEPIAAFNSERVAELYMLDCAAANPDFAYRLRRRGRVCGHIALQRQEIRRQRYSA